MFIPLSIFFLGTNLSNDTTVIIRTVSLRGAPFGELDPNRFQLRRNELSPERPMLRSTSAAGSSSVPRIIYGTAWKKERTADLVQLAIRKGFRAIDTACQPKHYNEAGVGEGIQRAYQEGIVRRENLFIQTKFTSLSGQDPKK